MQLDKLMSHQLEAALRILKQTGCLKQIDNEYFLPLTPEAVRVTARALVDEQGFVTTLQLKEQLREDGYYATQRDVSEEMTAMLEDEDEGLEQVNIETDAVEHRLFYHCTVPTPIAIAAYYATVKGIPGNCPMTCCRE